MNFIEYQKLSRRTMPEPERIYNGQQHYSDSAKTNYAMGLAGESGEVVDSMKKEIFHGHSVNREKKIEELGDVLHYFQGILQMENITLGEVMYHNIEKLKKRYPDGFSQEASIKRED